MRGSSIKKIAIDVRMARASGVGSYIRQMVPRVLAARRKDYFYLLGRRDEFQAWKVFLSSRVSWIPMDSSIYGIREQWELFRRTPLDADLFWAPFYNVPVLRRGKLLVTVHDVFHLAFPKFVHGFHRRVYARFMFSRLVAQAAAILCVSNFTRKELSRLTGADRKKINVVSNGVDRFWFEPERKKRVQKPYLLFVGNVKPHKNLKCLLEAFELIRDKIPHQLKIVGQKEGFITGDGAAIRQAESLGDRVRFTGFLKDEELRRCYASADLLVFPSLYEGFGLPPLEAMASGCPVASSNAASLPEVCGNAALFFNPEDPRAIARKILEVIKNKGVRDDLRRKGRRRAKEFSWEKTAAATNRVIDQVLG